MSQTIRRHVSATTAPRNSRTPLLGASLGGISAVLLLTLIQYAEAAAGYVDHVPACVLVIVLSSYAAAGAFVGSMFLPRAR